MSETGRKWLIGAGVAVVVVVVAFAALRMSQDKTPSDDNKSTEVATGSVEATDEASVVTTSQPKTGTDASASTTSTDAAKPKPTVAEPPAKGAELVTVTVPPAKTLAMISADNATADSRFAVDFKPYGVGPARGGVSTLVISVTASKASGDGSQKPYDFTGRNVLVNLTPQAASAVESGGAYRGTITLRKSGDVLIPWLDGVGPAS